jgi:hypothetical protein
MPETCVCRAKVASDCLDGSFEYPDGMADDSTYRAGSVVCDACYLVVEPVMRMNSDDVPRAVDEAVASYVGSLEYVREHPDPAALVAEATTVAEGARRGSPYEVSARYMAGMAQREVDRRAAVEDPDDG